MQDIAAFIRTIRRFSDLSQRELAARAGLPLSTVARIESGATSDPRWRTMTRIANACNVEIVGCDVFGVLDPLMEREIRDDAGRRFPAHLDVRRWQVSGDWWKDPYITDCFERPPEFTFDLSRPHRNYRRQRGAGSATFEGGG